MADETVCRGVCTITVDAEKPTEVTVLRIERDHENIETGSAVRHREVSRERGFADATRFAVHCVCEHRWNNGSIPNECTSDTNVSH